MKNSTQNSEAKRRQSRRVAEKAECSTQQQMTLSGGNPFAFPVTNGMRQYVDFELPVSFDTSLENLSPWVVEQLKKWESQRSAEAVVQVEKVEICETEQSGMVELPMEEDTEEAREETKTVQMETETAPVEAETPVIVEVPVVVEECPVGVETPVMEECPMTIQAPMMVEVPVRVPPPVRLEEITEENVVELKHVIETTMTNLFEDELYKGAIAIKEHCRLAYLDDIPVGYVMTHIQKGHRLVVTSVGVPFKHRKSGVGSVLMRYVESLCEKMEEVKKLSLYIQPSNTKGIRFFESFGMTKKQILTTYYKREPREAQRMTKIIRK